MTWAHWGEKSPLNCVEGMCPFSGRGLGRKEGHQGNIVSEDTQEGEGTAMESLVWL